MRAEVFAGLQLRLYLKVCVNVRVSEQHSKPYVLDSG